MKKTLVIIIAIVVIVGLYAFSTYNSLVTLNITADTQWKQVETDYQRRFDLIPNLVESVKGIMKQEQEVFIALAEARTRYSGATTVNSKALAAGQVEGALGRLLAIAESYPQLRSSENLAVFMSQLEGTENRISVERKRFNDAVKGYNLKVMRVPSSMIASLTGFKERAYFEVQAGVENAPQVKF